ncbi:Hypp8846 [Branchiostoma lanceolatum]|uniref:Hypp8846 protein n=1 Tax=Branchiostoma lanceolatum TaxID=7740 RepID=A0A8J9Z9S3_BRALA|nr:Hypp8846 [Branchiostoma lanceolatum]
MALSTDISRYVSPLQLLLAGVLLLSLLVLAAAQTTPAPEPETSAEPESTGSAEPETTPSSGVDGLLPLLSALVIPAYLAAYFR